MSPRPAALIAHKRDGGEHLESEIHFLIEGFQSGEVTDYQMSAWLMAVYLRGLSDAETVALTQAMLHSGTLLKPHRPGSRGPARVDKHSTGGVGDKISIPLAPLASACGLHVPMISGRGLGHTGGTLDKLESIPGYNARLSPRRFEQVLSKCGASIIGQTENIAPADKRIYALRDVTATVACRPLIVASILSKKLAAGLNGLVLDVKVGRGAFMKDKPSARALAQMLVNVSSQLGTPAVAQLTRMDEPLGRTIGNALEIRESISILKGEGPADTTALTLRLAEEMLLLARAHSSRRTARAHVKEVLLSGAAFERFVHMVELHGGDTRVLERPSLLPRVRTQIPVTCQERGIVQTIDALALAELSVDLGAGRKRAEDTVDPAVGLEVHVKVGDRVTRGDLLCTLHVRKKDSEAPRRARIAFEVGPEETACPSLFLGRPITPQSP